MPPRWMQSKLLKMAKSKRQAYLKKPRSGGVDTGKIASHDLFQNRSRVNTTQGRLGESLPVLNNTWTEPIPNTISHPSDAYTQQEVIKHHYALNHKGEKVRVEEKVIRYGPSHISLLNAERQAIKQERECLLDKLRSTWQGIRRTGVVTWHKVAMGTGGHVLYFSGNEFIFVQEDETTRWISKTYSGRAEAIKAFETRISWIIEEKKK